MKLTCELELIYSLAVSSGSIPSRSSRSRAAITLGKKPGSSNGGSRRSEELYVIVSTAKNVTGSKYKVRGNVVKVFCKFVEDGKATIEFKEPAHRLAISKADPAQLRELLKVLKLSPARHDSVSLSDLPPTKISDIEKPKTRLVVKSRGDYPLRGIPSSLERFEAVGVSLNRVDRRLLQLKHLTHLDLSGNIIKVLPEAMANAHLVELRLSGNRLEEFPEPLCVGKLGESLKLLDLARNQLKSLPHKFPQMKCLVHLKLDCNQLQVLPRSFGRMTSLKFLSVSSNRLLALPSSFLKLSLDSLDLYGNQFHPSGLVKRCSGLSLPPLMELAGRTIKKHKIAYDPYTVPVTLCHYLDSAKKCLCGCACFSTYLHHIAPLDLHRVSATVTATDKQGSTRASVEMFLCSAKCLRLWRLNQ